MGSQEFRTPLSRPADETSIRALYKQLIDGWNQGSGEAFAAPFAENADLVGFDGTHLKGRQEIASFHQQLFDTYVKGTHMVGKVRSVRFLTPDVAIIHAVSGTVMPGQQDLEPERNSVQTLVAAKYNGQWFLVAFQNTRAQFMGRQEMGQELMDELRKEL